MAERFRTMAFSIDTERLSLRLRTKHDAECNLELLREHEGGTALSIGEVEQRMVEQNERAQVDGFGPFEKPEIAYEVLPQFRGHSYATEAARAVIKAAFATGRKRLWATVGTWNAPSFRVLEKNAFHTHHSDCDERGEFAWMVRSAAN